MDGKAVEYAKEFLQLIGKPTDKLMVNICKAAVIACLRGIKMSISQTLF